ncbi:MAG: hypothetical protein KDE33_20830 [Bacteroidetes bacterium]|nr:hypothetical protein [Bacteroidota bacterium]
MLHLFPNGQVEVPCVKRGRPSYRWTPAYSQAISPTSYSNPLSRRHWYDIAARDGELLKFHKTREEANESNDKRGTRAEDSGRN